MLEVIGAGLPRTGTTSMKAALERLGFGPCYHMFEVMTHPDHVDRWHSVTAGEVRDREGWDRVFAGGYRSAQDWPASHYWRELAEVYPDAKVVLTVRDPRSWYPSINMLLSGPGAAAATMNGQPFEELPEPVRAMLTGMGRMGPVLEAIGRSYFGPGWSFGQGVPDEEYAVEAFERHVAAVKADVPAKRLLVFDVREGWEPLCGFLGVEAPAEPFPHLNDADSMRQTFERMMSGEPITFPQPR
ncbi:sulfotransferase family protein [Nonomuraea sp. 3-1Str]|uniref:sulfotransferase family protein n=1 Tax=Nonomuraea sp. 3-1Str TaxID=2929801 RepID=UPI0028577CE5|nr:sulfotransferase [Nonomuraea sp. 3-1Str]MDR8408212.1 sulfotransferase family protein [Nonomuraea sp. 3-1Str]